MVFSLNYFAGNRFPIWHAVLLAGGIAIVFVSVYVITWLSDRKSARDFNAELKKFQKVAND